MKVRQTLTRSRVDGTATKTALIFQEPKTKQLKRDVPLPASVLTELKSYRAHRNQEKLIIGEAYQDNHLVFCTADGRPIDPRNLLRHHEILLKQAGLSYVSFHDLRHTFATMLLEINEQPKVVQELLGHSKISITLDIYSHASIALKERAAAKLDEFLTIKEKLPAVKREK